MGTVFAVEIDGEHDHAAVESIFDWWREVETRFSTFRDDSEISRLGRGDLALDDTHPDVRHVLSVCRELEQSTNRHFAIGDGPDLDPAGYVKGWSVDEAALVLRGEGINDFLVYAGGDVLCVGSPADGDAWRVGIRDPFDRDRSIVSLRIERGAVATSGAYERGDHVRGSGAGGLASVSVVGPSLGIADALATAAFAAGPDDVGWLSRFQGYGAVLVRHDGSLAVTGDPMGMVGSTSAPPPDEERSEDDGR
jgi:thiamine biosynthesis lipoprotein